MKRRLWAMPDNEVYELREKAHKLLRQLYVSYEEWQAWATKQVERLQIMKKTSIDYAATEMDARQAWKRVAILEQQIAAQRQFCASLDNEYLTRNPPFWTKQDLADMDAYRDGYGADGGGWGNGRRGGL